ncbi:MAG TPA: NAD(P) transhydrogenase subunit alpha [Puia sp.]|nr:NAD(P) transhydrogenase subunit alpha [Puia sp.]
MIVGVLREPSFESRVSLLAEGAAVLMKRKLTVWVQSGAGSLAYCPDAAYSSVGALVRSREELISGADVLLGIHPENIPETVRGKVLVGVFNPLFNASVMAMWARQKITCFSLDMLPRTTRAQPMDVLSSQANIAGYKAVLVAAGIFPRYFPMFMTAAGSIPPAKVLVLGAGVAGLQAIATARRLGAVVEVFDTRPAVKEEVMSLGGKFIEVDGAADASKAGGYAVEQSVDFAQRQQDRIAESVARADVIITTAQIPGRRAPVLVTAAMIQTMRPGSVIVDLAAATGGNTELTSSNETVVHDGVMIVGNSALASTMPYDASKLYGKNVLNFLELIFDGAGRLKPDMNDELVKGCCITFGGEVVNERVKALGEG